MSIKHNESFFEINSSILNDVAVIIRSTGERSESLTKFSIIKNGILKENIYFVKNIAPFSNALKKGYELALKINKKYTFFIDADMIVIPNSLLCMLHAIDRFPKKIFFMNPLVYDYLTGYVEPNGPHLYRTEYINHALKLVEQEKVTLRPETYVVKEMHKKGYEVIHLDFPVALHGFEQYYKDIFRASITKFLKNKSRGEYIFKRAKNFKEENENFYVVNKAEYIARKYCGQLNLDYKQFDKEFEALKIKEKEDVIDIEKTYDRLLLSFKKDAYMYNGYTNTMDIKQMNVLKKIMIRLYKKLI